MVFHSAPWIMNMRESSIHQVNEDDFSVCVGLFVCFFFRQLVYILCEVDLNSYFGFVFIRFRCHRMQFSTSHRLVHDVYSVQSLQYKFSDWNKSMRLWHALHALTNFCVATAEIENHYKCGSNALDCFVAPCTTI